jgi:hypothetical protein
LVVGSLFELYKQPGSGDPAACRDLGASHTSVCPSF